MVECCNCDAFEVNIFFQLPSLTRSRMRMRMWTRNNWVLAFQIVYQQTIEIKDILDNTLFILIKTEHVQFKEERDRERARAHEKKWGLWTHCVHCVLCTCIHRHRHRHSRTTKCLDSSGWWQEAEEEEEKNLVAPNALKFSHHSNCHITF